MIEWTYDSNSQTITLHIEKNLIKGEEQKKLSPKGHYSMTFWESFFYFISRSIRTFKLTIIKRSIEPFSLQ